MRRLRRILLKDIGEDWYCVRVRRPHWAASLLSPVSEIGQSLPTPYEALIRYLTICKAQYPGQFIAFKVEEEKERDRRTEMEPQEVPKKSFCIFFKDPTDHWTLLGIFNGHMTSTTTIKVNKRSYSGKDAHYRFDIYVNICRKLGLLANLSDLSFTVPTPLFHGEG